MLLQFQNDLRDVHIFAREQLQKSLHRRKQQYDKRKFHVTYHPGDLVYIINESSTKGLSRKLQPVFKGPFIVTHQVSDVLYQLQGRRLTDVKVMHHDRMKICKDRDVPLWIRRKRAVILGDTPSPTVDLDETLHLPSLFDKEEGDPESDFPQDVSEDQDPPEQEFNFLPGILRDLRKEHGDRRMTRRVRPPERFRH